MHSINLFVEDRGHTLFLQTLIYRFANQYGISINIKVSSSSGGHGAVLSKLKEYINDLLHEQGALPDILIAATDGNCKGYVGRRQEIDNALRGFNGRIVYAIPDPHVERWLLLDSTAFKRVLGRGCDAPLRKCERGLYKRLLLQAIRATGVNPPLGGIEYTEDIVNAMDLDYLEHNDESLGKLLKELRQIFQQWQRSEQADMQELHEDAALYILDADANNLQA
jgi:hypothetical protein